MKRVQAVLLAFCILTLATGLAEAQMRQAQQGAGQNIAVNRLLNTSRIEGMHVFGAGGEDIGEIERVLFNPQTGKIELLVMSYGGFLDIGEDSVAIPYQSFGMTQRGLTLNVTDEQLQNAPRFNPREFTYYEPDYTERVYTYWGYPYDTYAWTERGVWGQGWDYGYGEGIYGEGVFGGEPGAGLQRQGAVIEREGQQGWLYRQGQMGGQMQQQGQTQQRQGQTNTWTGTISQTRDGYIFTTQNVPFQLRNAPQNIGQYEGQQVRLTGRQVGGATIAVQDIQSTRGQQGQMGGQTQQQGQQQLTGLIDTKGQDYILRANGKTYTLQGAENQLQRLIGERATVSGRIQGQQIQVSSVQGQQGQTGGQMGGQTQQGQQGSWTGFVDRSGNNYVLQVGDNEYSLKGADRNLKNLVGQRVRVTGQIQGENIQVSSIQQAGQQGGMGGSQGQQSQQNR